MADVNKLMTEIHEAHYVHGFKFSAPARLLLEQLQRELAADKQIEWHTGEKNAQARAYVTARGTQIKAEDVHPDMFNDRIAALTTDARAANKE
jgi:hypothetical protein